MGSEEREAKLKRKSGSESKATPVPALYSS
jgi:hypothetical protein